ncbi:sulfatase-like hydrolase/transferase [Halomarina pelagica]|uniref:sulfatase-like hydrolase/transferase n=1 Tax=Halomarina pelagica TaxID=2961599 RepID=UPI0020C27BCD|nr:sulfatase-like hydrolase/transferase [Halomarina sp. BND7]
MSSSRERPNVLLILTDQQRWDTVGAYGSPMDLTPTLDALARRGTRLENAVTPQPTCGPAKAALQTGKHATETGVWRLSRSIAGERTLAHHFGDAGYDVGFVGSWHIAGTHDAPVPRDRRGGYEDVWIAADVPEFTTSPEEGHLYDESGEPVEFERYRADAFTDFAAEALDALEEPFFLVVSYLEPHDQNDRWTFVAPDGYADRHATNPYVPPDLRGRPGEWYDELPDYYGMCERLDECVARLLSVLDRGGLREDTVVGYTSDHGCHFRTRPGEHKRTCHESAIRVPAILSGPGFDRGRTVERVTSLVDLAPTLLDAAGVPIPDGLHGESLLPVIRGERPDGGGEAFVQISESEIGRAIRTPRWKYAVAAPTENGWRGGNGDPNSDVYLERYLYDLGRDPEESVNLVGRYDYRDVADDLRERLAAHIERVEGHEPDIRRFEDPGYREY